jgi:transposase InsO family protein
MRQQTTSRRIGQRARRGRRALSKFEPPPCRVGHYWQFVPESPHIRAWFKCMGITVEGVLSDNGSCYRSGVHAKACAELGMRHLFTRPYRPRTNGKAERFIQTLTNRWAYGAIYGDSAERTAALPGWLDHHNFRRGHGSLGHRPPAARLAELEQPRE